jgi:hypothetical protein
MRSTRAPSAADEERDGLESLPAQPPAGASAACSSWAKRPAPRSSSRTGHSQVLKLDWVRPAVVADGLAESPLAKSRIRQSHIPVGSERRERAGTRTRAEWRRCRPGLRGGARRRRASRPGVLTAFRPAASSLSGWVAWCRAAPQPSRRADSPLHPGSAALAPAPAARRLRLRRRPVWRPRWPARGEGSGHPDVAATRPSGAADREGWSPLDPAR